jgi:hypothetical protein
MDQARRHRFIERYRSGVDAVVVAIEHVTADHLDTRTDADAKLPSAREIIHHIAHAELHASVTLRRMLSENRPVLVPLDDRYHFESLHYDRPVEHSVEVFRTLALANIELLEWLTDDQWRREGNQQKPWPLTVESWLEEEVAHVLNHMMHILNAASGGRVIADPD